MDRTSMMAKSAPSIADFAQEYIGRLSDVLNGIAFESVEAFKAELLRVRNAGNTIFVAGNGGSSSTAMTMANDLGFDVFRKTGRGAFRMVALTENSSVVTAIANDVGYEDVFVSQLKVHYRSGDALLAISASGNSSNLLRAAKWVREQGGRTIGLVGFDGGELSHLCDVLVHVSTDVGEYGVVEDSHIVLNHILAHWFQQRLQNGNDGGSG